MATDPRHPPLDDDEALLAALGQALDHDESVPPELVRLASAAWSWRAVDEELAELLHDSARDATVGVRDAASARLVSFAHADVGLDLEIDGDELVGVVRPPGRYGVELRTPGATERVDTDGAGMFRFAAGRGPSRLAVSPAGDGSTLLVTPWFDV